MGRRSDRSSVQAVSHLKRQAQRALPYQLLHWECKQSTRAATSHSAQSRGTEREQEEDGLCTGGRRDEVGRDV